MLHRVAFLVCLLVVVANTAGAADDVDFNRDVRPILSNKCFFCHGPDEQHREANLRLDQAPTAGTKSVIKLGTPTESELFRRITTTDRDAQMLPAKSGKTRSSTEIATLRQWIVDGAKWSTHWAYVTPLKHEPPKVQNTNWPANDIDHFLLARWEREKIAPSSEADRITLIRRLSFDLRGLPPTPNEVDTFVKDTGVGAWEKLVDRFLVTEAYGELMAIFWLDLVRYADTVGYHGDQEHHISPYRDWVIDAFIETAVDPKCWTCLLCLPDKQKRWFVDLREAIQKMIDNGKSLDDIKQMIDLPFYKEWTGVDAKTRVENVEHIYGELTKKKSG